MGFCQQLRMLLPFLDPPTDNILDFSFANLASPVNSDAGCRKPTFKFSSWCCVATDTQLFPIETICIFSTKPTSLIFMRIEKNKSSKVIKLLSNLIKFEVSNFRYIKTLCIMSVTSNHTYFKSNFPRNPHLTHIQWHETKPNQKIQSP